MPKKLKISPNERIDIPDLYRAANDYTSESVSFNAKSVLMGDVGCVLEGFRVKIVNTVGNPSEIVVYNGTAIDSAGTPITNEADPSYAQRVTLPSASTTFYIEIVFEEVDSDEDDRAFWDPTVPNTTPIPKGKEYSFPVVSRITPTWRIVRPISTTGFEWSLTNTTSRKIPLVCLTTNGVSQVVAGGANPGLTMVRPATVTTSDHTTLNTAIKVADSRLFTAGDSVRIDPDGITLGPSGSINSISSVDLVNNVLVLSSGIGNSYPAGTVIRNNTTSAIFVAERAGIVNTNPTVHPDNRQRFFQGEEIRGSGLSVSKENATKRDDLNLRTFKDSIDFISAQLREMKWGSLRVGEDGVEDSRTPPNSFNISSISPRYYDKTRSIQGAGSYTITVGDGVNSYGDFNGGTHAALQAAMDAAPSGSTIFIKHGVYDISTTVTISKSLSILGDGPGTVIQAAANVLLLRSTSASGASISISDVSLAGYASNARVFDSDNHLDSLSVQNCTITGSVYFYSAGSFLFRYNTMYAVGSTNELLGGASVPSIVLCCITDCEFITQNSTCVLRANNITKLVVSNVTWWCTDSTTFTSSGSILLHVPYSLHANIENIEILCSGTRAPLLLNMPFSRVCNIENIYLSASASVFDSADNFIHIACFNDASIKNLFTYYPIASDDSSGSLKFLYLGDNLRNLTGAIEHNKLIVDNCYINFTDINNGIGIYTGTASLVSPVQYNLDCAIKNTTIRSARTGIFSRHPGKLYVDNCNITGVSLAYSCRTGIDATTFIDNSTLEVVVANTTIQKLQYTSASTIYGILINTEVSASDSAVTNLSVDNCLFYKLGNPSAASTTAVYGVYTSPPTTFEKNSIISNNFVELSGPGSCVVEPISIQSYNVGSGYSSFGNSIQNNYLANIGANANSVVGIKISQASSGVAGMGSVSNTDISHNCMYLLQSASGANLGIFIKQTGSGGFVGSTSITNNVLNGVGNANSIYGAQIGVESQNISGLSISDNFCYSAPIFTRSTGVGCYILVTEPSTGGVAENVKVCNNTLVSGDEATGSANGILLYGTAGSTPNSFTAWPRLFVEGNTVVLNQTWNTTGVMYGIALAGIAEDVRVCQNSVVNLAINPATCLLAISGVSNSARAKRAVISNNTLASLSTAYTVNQTYFNHITFFTMTGNIIDTRQGTELSVSGAAPIMVFDGYTSHGMISGNYIKAVTAPNDTIVFGGLCSNIIGVGNNFGMATGIQISGTSTVSHVVVPYSNSATLAANALNFGL